MTHGCGTVSSGGGGFSGGGATMSTVLIAGAHQSARRRNNDDDTDCCCALCWLIAFLLCFVKMTPKARIVLTWVWVIAASLTAGLLVRNHSFGDKQLSDSPWDMRQVDVDSSFCTSISISASDSVDVYALPFSPQVEARTRRKSSPTFFSWISYNRYEYWGFYFIEGSSVSALIKSVGSQFDFYVIKGKSNLDKWIDNGDCDDCYWYSTTVLLGTYGYKPSFHFTETDQYYFLFSNVYSSGYSGIDMDATFHLNRTVYDVTTGGLECHSSEICEVDLDLGSSTNIILDVPKDSPDDIYVIVTCNPRDYLYVLVFGMVPAFIGICISLGIYKYSKRGQTNSTRRDGRNTTNTTRSSGRNTTRRQGRDNPVYTVSGDQLNAVATDRFSARPPSYKEKPPSYQEAVNMA